MGTIVTTVAEALELLGDGIAGDCAFSSGSYGGRYPRQWDRVPNWADLPCEWVSLNCVNVRFSTPLPRLGDVVAEAEASGRVFFNDTPQIDGSMPTDLRFSRVFAYRRTDGSPHPIAWQLGQAPDGRYTTRQVNSADVTWTE